MVEGSLLPLRSKALWVLWLWDSHSQARIRADSSVRYVEWCQEKAWRSDGRQRQEGWRWHRITGRLWNSAIPLLLLLSSPEVASEGIRLGFRIHCPQGSVYTSSCFASHWASENARHFFLRKCSVWFWLAFSPRLSSWAACRFCCLSVSFGLGPGQSPSGH